MNLKAGIGGGGGEGEKQQRALDWIRAETLGKKIPFLSCLPEPVTLKAAIYSIRGKHLFFLSLCAF